MPHIHLNKEVQKINYHKSISSSKQIQIDCLDGSTYSADHIICTVSLGVLKERHLSLFDPILPSEKFDCIEGLSIGTVDKIFVEFEKPFWNDDWNGFSMLWKLEQLKLCREDLINSEWLEGIIGFFRVSYQPNILCGWITGAMARKMEQKNIGDVKAGVEKIFHMFLNRHNITEIKNIVR